VFNRLAYSPRPGDLDAFRALAGATPAEKLNTWLNTQLNPSSIDDSDCTNRVIAHALPTQVFNDNLGGAPVTTQPPPPNPGLNRKVYAPAVMRGGSSGGGNTLTNTSPNAVIENHWINYRRRPNRGGLYPSWRPAADVRIATLLRATYSRRQLFEVMVEFWHNHFSIFAWEGYAEVTWQHYDAFVIRKHALGNFLEMLKDVAVSPAMLYYLDNYENTVAGPNENWARELFELHGLGAENYGGVKPQAQVPGYPTAPTQYVDNDVYESTRCFTGWTVDDRWGNDNDPTSWGKGVFVYSGADHDRFQKNILGVQLAPDNAPMADGNTVLELIANHPGTARYIARRLCRRLIGDDPGETTVQAVANVFFNARNAPDQIAQTVRAIATSAEFAGTWAAKVKRPYEAAIGMFRATGAQLNFRPRAVTEANGNQYWNDVNEFFWYFDAMGQPMFGRRPPDGWPDRRRAWSGSTSMLMRWKLANWMTWAGTVKDRTDIRIDLVGVTNAGVPSRTAANVVDFWLNRILGRSIAADARADMIALLGQGNLSQPINFAEERAATRLRLVVALIVSSPDPMSFNARMSRRGFLVGCSSAIAALAGSRLTHIALAAPDGADAPNETIVVVFLRGGLDGMNAVLPIGGADRAIYERDRPTLKVPVTAAGQIPGALGIGNLGGTPFGFHPGLAAFKELYDAGALAVVHAAGLVHDTRSHFDAMQFMETGTPGVKTTGTGWITRHLQSAPAYPGNVIMPALSAGSTPAMALMGREDLVTMNGVNGFDFNGDWQYEGQQRNVLRRMYTGDNWLHLAGAETLDAMDIIDSRVSSSYTPAPNAAYVQYNGFSDQLKTIAQLIKADLGLRTATIDLGGWDTHESQQNGGGDPRGYFLGALDNLARGLRAFYNDIAASGHHTRTTVVVMSEFGRRFKENSNRGTDHGHGNCMFVLGGNVNGGRMFGQWPGLASLYDNADLRITTDYRTVLSEILAVRAANPNWASVFPNYTYPGALGIVR
jgi:uncharacterized protein (DUF1501 family)/uncharacterized protein (DUF1800 family)